MTQILTILQLFIEILPMLKQAAKAGKKEILLRRLRNKREEIGNIFENLASEEKSDEEIADMASNFNDVFRK